MSEYIPPKFRTVDAARRFPHNGPAKDRGVDVVEPPRSKYDQVALALATKGKEGLAKEWMEWIGRLKARIDLFRITSTETVINLGSRQCVVSGELLNSAI